MREKFLYQSIDKQIRRIKNSPQLNIFVYYIFIVGFPLLFNKRVIEASHYTHNRVIVNPLLNPLVNLRKSDFGFTPNHAHTLYHI